MFEIDVKLAVDEFVVQPEIQADMGMIVLFGPSGAGKSLTLQCVAGLVRPDSGRIVVNDRVLFDSDRNLFLAPQERRVGYVPQDYALFPHLSVAGNVAFGLTRMSRASKRRAVDEALDLVNLAGLGDRRPAELSGGQQQRVALARALIRRPDILLLDEPFAALDAPVRKELRHQVKELQRRLGILTLFITHDLSEASFIADQIAVFDRGRVHQMGTPSEILMRPADLKVAQVVGVKNILSGTVVQASEECLVITTGRVTMQTPAYPFEVGAPVHLFIRPERVMLRRKDRPPDPRPNLFLGRVVDEISDGLNCTLYFDLSHSVERQPEAVSDLCIDLPVYIYERLGLADVREWTASIPPGAIHVVRAETG